MRPVIAPRRSLQFILLSAALAAVGFLTRCSTCQADATKESPIVSPLPGTGPLPADVVERFEEKWRNRDPDYEPRTQYLNPDGSPKYTNRLFLETSPYLLQHAHNPVNWHPWGDEAFEKAREMDRPVLLSVGYSTCHWCHVMEEESFDNEEIARIINENYIPIKVDREVRPDVDAIYMAAVQAFSGRGGWPMTVWLTPDRKPYYAGTYFPPRAGDRGARVGFVTLLERLSGAYHEQPERVAGQADKIAAVVSRSLAPESGGSLPSRDVLEKAASYYGERFDSKWGGLEGAPKFPSSLPVSFLLRWHRRSGSEQALEMASLTLERMAAGGMHDQIGGGFHRYSTDSRWLVPHFEKMLYDNALLTVAYLEGFQATGRERFAEVARTTLRYVEREMTSPQGAFYSATDADSMTPEGHREEGWFFTWTPEEMTEVLGEERARIAMAHWGVAEEGNFEGRSILHIAKTPAEVAEALELSAEKVRQAIQESRKALYEARSARPPPLRDEKILTAWNGLMISAFARASLVLDEPDYAEDARKAAGFLLEELRRGGRLLRSFNNGEASGAAFLDDYAFLIAGLLDLYEATGELRWMREAIALDQVLAEHYEDEENGGLFATSDDHEQLLAREKPGYDGVEPSGNSVAAMNLLRLYEFTTEEAYRKRAGKTFRAFQQTLEESPAALSEMLNALDFYYDTPKQILIVAPESRRQVEPFLTELRRYFLPNRILSAVAEEEELDAHSELIPLLNQKRAIGGKATAYVCEQRVCELPTADPAVFARQIRE